MAMAWIRASKVRAPASRGQRKRVAHIPTPTAASADRWRIELRCERLGPQPRPPFSAIGIAIVLVLIDEIAAPHTSHSVKLHRALTDTMPDNVRQIAERDSLTRTANGHLRIFRVLTLKQASEGESLDVQRRQIEGYAIMHGLDIEEIVVEEGVSGSGACHRAPHRWSPIRPAGEGRHHHQSQARPALSLGHRPAQRGRGTAQTRGCIVVRFKAAAFSTRYRPMRRAPRQLGWQPPFYS